MEHSINTQVRSDRTSRTTRAPLLTPQTTERRPKSSSSGEKKTQSSSRHSTHAGSKRKTMDNDAAASATSEPRKKKFYEQMPYPPRHFGARDEQRAWFSSNNLMREYEVAVKFCDHYRHAYMDLLEFRADVLSEFIVDQAKQHAERSLRAYEGSILGAVRGKFETMRECQSDPHRYASNGKRLSMLMRLIEKREADPDVHSFRTMAVLGHPSDKQELKAAVLGLFHRETLGSPDEVAADARAKDLDVRSPITDIPLTMIVDILHSVDRDMKTEELLKAGEKWKALRFPETDEVDLMALLGKLILSMGHVDDLDKGPASASELPYPRNAAVMSVVSATSPDAAQC